MCERYPGQMSEVDAYWLIGLGVGGSILIVAMCVVGFALFIASM